MIVSQLAIFLLLQMFHATHGRLGASFEDSQGAMQTMCFGNVLFYIDYKATPLQDSYGNDATLDQTLPSTCTSPPKARPGLVPTPDSSSSFEVYRMPTNTPRVPAGSCVQVSLGMTEDAFGFCTLDQFLVAAQSSSNTGGGTTFLGDSAGTSSFAFEAPANGEFDLVVYRTTPLELYPANCVIYVDLLCDNGCGPNVFFWA